MRCESRTSLTGPYVDHLVGRTRPETAREPTSGESVVGLDEHGEPATREHGLGLLQLARQQVAEQKKRRKREKLKGRHPQPYREFLFGNGPADDPLPWTKDCVGWLRGVLGSDVQVATAALHRDEADPAHLHVVVLMPPGGWAEVERTSRVGAGKLRGRHFLSALQDDLHGEVASKYGLERGVKGSKALHAEIDRSRSLESRVKHLEGRLERTRNNFLVLAHAVMHLAPEPGQAMAAFEGAGVTKKHAEETYKVLSQLKRTPERTPERPPTPKRKPEPAERTPARGGR